MALNGDIMPLMLKGMLATHHHKQRSSSLIKEQIFVKCQCNPCSASTKADNLFNVYSKANATDINAFLGLLNTNLFPGVSSPIKVHNGFASEQAK